ncbi:MAG: Ig-like domain-containing protein, partial [Acidimicrobiales bacterium]
MQTLAWREAHGQHARRRAWWKRWWAILGVVVLVCAGAGVATAATLRAQHNAHVVAMRKAAAARAAARAAAESRLAAAITISPAAGTSGVALDASVTVGTALGTLASVRVVGPQGTPVPGTLAAGGQSWKSSGPLRPSTSYEVTASVSGQGGLSAKSATHFTTLTPTARVEATIAPSDGLTVGVGQPIVVKFDHYVHTDAAQAAVLSHFTVTESDPVPGGWHWFSLDELHFRPESYWPTGEKITVTANLDGWDAGGGNWGSGTVTSQFTVGDSHISVANLQTHEMTVSDNGKAIATYPISAGRTQYPTMGGIHIVMDREHVVRMDSATVGIPVNSPNGYDELVYNDVHISDSGEYVHDAPWSVGAQGNTNVSHGCVNLSPTDSLAFFNFSRVGDIVEVVGSPRPPAYGDHGVMDWSTPWSEWTPGTV